MIMSMTGFGSSEGEVVGFGKIRVELRSTNHKFLETVLHLPEGFLSLEERITKEVEAKTKRGRITGTVSILDGKPSSIFINKGLLRSYISTIRGIKNQFHIKDEPRIDTLIHLPGVLSLIQDAHSQIKVWPHLKILVKRALDDLVTIRRKEGEALYRYLKFRSQALKVSLDIIKRRFKKVVQDKLAKASSDEERSSLLKDIDITEEVERLAFHIGSFIHKLSKGGLVGKELDFITQEMQREANTMGAKSCDTQISGRVIQIKSQVEKIREQLQNIE